MQYPEDAEPIEIKGETVGLIRKAMLPLLKDVVSNADMEALATSFVEELAKMSKRIEENKPADVDMNPVAELMGAVLELQKRSIENNITLDAPQLEALTTSVSEAVDYMKSQADVQTELFKSFSTPQPVKVEIPPEMRIANLDEINIPPSQAVFNAKYPFTLNGQNVAMPLVSTVSGLGLPVVNPDGTFIGGGSSGGGGTVPGGTVTISGVVSTTVSGLSLLATDQAVYEAQTRGNLIHNYDFESGITGWAIQNTGTTLSSDSTSSKYGSKSLKVVTDGSVAGQGTNYVGLSWQAGDTFNCRAWIKGTAGDTIALVLFDGSGTSVTQLFTVLQTGVFERFEMQATAAFTTTNGFFVISTNAAAAVTWYVDSVSVTPVNFRVKNTGKASNSIPTPLSDGQQVDNWDDRYGRQVVVDIDTEYGNEQGRTSLRDNLIAQRYTVIADSIADGLNNIWTQTTVTGGTITITSGEGQLATSAAAGGAAQLSSTLLRYHPGQESWLNSAFRFAGQTAGNLQRIGAFTTVSGTTPQDGFFYELNGTSFDAVVIKAGVEQSRTPSTSWSKFAQYPFTIDTNYHSFELRYTANGVSFYVDNRLRHRFAGTAAAITNTLDFPMTIQNINTTNATNRVAGIRNIGMGRFGTPPQEYTSGSIATDQAGAAGVLTFTFPTPVDFIWVTDVGAVAANVSRVDPFGGTPAANTGIAVYNATPTPISVVPASNTVKVYAPVGSTISMYGLRYV